MGLDQIFNKKEIKSISEMVDYLIERNHYLNYRNINYYEKYASRTLLVIGREDIDIKKIQRWLNLINPVSGTGLLNKFWSEYKDKQPNIRKEIKHIPDSIGAIYDDLTVLLKIKSKKSKKKSKKKSNNAAAISETKSNKAKTTNRLSRPEIIKTILRKCSDKKYIRQYVDLDYSDKNFNSNLHIFSSTLSPGCALPKLKKLLEHQLNSLSNSDFKKIEKKFVKSKK